jgi:8-hydroxy-5-deazaflavin:NADPH oxidoreductase
MTSKTLGDAAKAVVRRNTEEVQGGGNFELFDELFADDFLDHTPQPGRTPDKSGARQLYKTLRSAFPDFHAEIHWQLADGDRVTTYKTYHGTHRGEFLGAAPTGRKIHFETVDVMRVRDGKIAEHWGVANLFSLMQQLGAWPQAKSAFEQGTQPQPRKEHHMTIGIIGSGAIGTALARTLARGGIEATISNSRGPDSLKQLIREFGPLIQAGTREQAARADIVFVAVNWTKLPAALDGLTDWGGRIVIDANNPIEAPLFKPVDLKGRVSSEVFADLVPGARVVKAFNHLRAEVLARDPRTDGGQRVLFYSGDDKAAKAEVAALIDRIGFLGIDLGLLAVGGKLAQFPGGPLPNQNLIKVG